MQLEIHREIPQNPELRQQWNALVEQMERPEIFYTWEWAQAMQAAYGRVRQPWIAVAREEATVVGVTALTFLGGRAEFLSATTADYCDVVSAAGRRRELLDAVFGELRRSGCRDVILASIPKDSATADAIAPAARARGFRAFVRPASDCAQICFGNEEERKRLSAALEKKKWFRRGMNALSREAPVELSNLQNWCEVEPILPRFARAHVARFLNTQRVSNLVRKDRRLFLFELARLLSEPGWFCLTRLHWGDRPIAWNYGFRFAGSWFWYQPTIDSACEEYSPGRLLLGNMVREGCDTPGLQLLDLGLGAEGYKEGFANAVRSTIDVALSRSASRALHHAVRYRLAERVKRSPQLEASVRKGLSRIQAARRRLRDGGPVGFASWASQVAKRSVLSKQQVRFYEWPAQGGAVQGEETLVPANLEILAQVAMDHDDDAETLAYLLQSAQRMQSGTAEGFSLHSASGETLHLCWATDFEGFSIAELQTVLSAPSADAAMIFDCWTPMAGRGHGAYAKAISRLANLLRERGRRPWIFAASTNRPSVKGIEAAGFRYRYTMVSKKTPAGRKLSTVTAEHGLGDGR